MINYIKVFNVAFGDCFIIDENDFKLLIDCGSMTSERKNMVTQSVDAEMSVKKEKYGILSHFHKDHYKYLMDLKTRFSNFYCPNFITKVDIGIFVMTLLLSSPQNQIYQDAKSFLEIAKIPEIMDSNGIIFFVSTLTKRIINNNYRILWPPRNVSQNDNILYQTLINKFTEQQQQLINDFIDHYLSFFENTETSVNEPRLTQNGLEQFYSIIPPKINDLINQIQPQLSLSSDEIESLRNHQNEFCLVFDNTSSEKSVLFLSDIDKNNFENNIKTKLLNNYWIIKIAHHGTFRHFTNKLPDSKYKIIPNSFYKNTSWGITADYPNNYASKFICTNNSNCQYYLANGKKCLSSYKCGINNTFFETIV